ncbi:MAG: FtsX-like permease family protein [Ferruginibacter sp.]
MKQDKQQLSYKSVSAFFDTASNRSSGFFSYAGLAIGVLMLLCATQMFININELLREKNARKNGFDFISLTKTITDENMGHDNRFTQAEIDEIKAQPFIADAAPLIGNQFRAKASAGKIIPFSTDLFLEAIQNNFLDTLPPNFTWQPGQQTVPVVFSADFLEMYNVFAPAQDLPQLSENSISSVNIVLECYGPLGVYNFKANIVGISDRINSVLVPENFLQWANKSFGNVTNVPAARVYIKTGDANSAELLNFLQQKNYHVNKDKTKFGRVKQILQAVVSGLAIFALLVILLAMMLFSFYLQLMIARSKDNLQLLILLGYSPGWLSKTVAKKWIPIYAAIIMIALALTFLLQYLFQQNLVTVRDSLQPLAHYSIVLISIVLLFLCISVNYGMIKKLLMKL